MPFVITEPCINIKDKACVGVCPVDCIYDFEGEAQLYIHPDECIECGACQPVCPVNAIYMDAEIPPGQERFIELNAEKCRTFKRLNAHNHALIQPYSKRQ